MYLIPFHALPHLNRFTLRFVQCQFRPQYLNNNRLSTINGWTRGSYQCLCKQGFYSIRHPDGFNGTIMEVAYEEYLTNASSFYVDSFLCLPCLEGCVSCTGPTPCLARYNWPFRLAAITWSVSRRLNFLLHSQNRHPNDIDLLRFLHGRLGCLHVPQPED